MPKNNLLDVDIREGERAVIIGATGSGKTVMARALLRDVPRLVVLDPKGTLGKWGLEEWNEDTQQRLYDREPVRVRVVLEGGRDSEKFWESVLQEVYEATDLVAYIDEAYGINDSTKPGPWLNAVWTRGREFRETGIAATQRPRNIPRVFLTEAEHYFIFTLRHPEDRKYVAGFIAPELEEKVPDKHGFWYFNVNQDKPIYVPSLPKDLQRFSIDTPDLLMEESDHASA